MQRHRSALGRPYSTFALTDAFRKLARKAGIEKPLHELRHTALSNMLEGGTDVVTVAAIAGHSTIQTTLHTYAHLMPGTAEQAVDKLDARLQSAIEQGRKGDDGG